MNLSIEVARKILEASKQRAYELRSPVSIAIVDAAGHLVLFERMMAPYGWATGQICIAKATTAVMFNQSTDVIAQWGTSIPGFASSMAAMTQGKFIMAAGGWPIRIAGETVGGIGVSGGNGPGRDDEIARAGVAAAEAAAPPVPLPSSQVSRPPQSASQSQPQQRSSLQSTPSYPSMSGYQSQQPGTSSQQNVPVNTRHLTPNQEHSESLSFDSSNENRGGQS